MTEQEKIFVNTIDDLQLRFERKTEYDLLRASGLIRQLLIDANPLLDQVNKKLKIKIRFKVQKRINIFEDQIDSDGKVLPHMNGIIFISPPKSSDFVEYLNKSDFLKYELLSHFERKFTVLDVIKICANKYGGIHFDKIQDEKFLDLNKLNSSLKLNNSKSIYHALNGIIEVSLNTLLPLKNIISQP